MAPKFRTAVNSKHKYESGVTEEAAIKVLVQVKMDSKRSTNRASVPAASLEYI